MKSRPRRNPLLSLILPVYNESTSLPIFFNEVDQKLSCLNLELLFIDDGSKDDTVSQLCNISTKDNRVRVIKLSRNFGKEAALTAGIEHCRGDIAIPGRPHEKRWIK